MDGVIVTKKIHCQGCRLGCGLVLQIKQGLVVDVLGDREEPLSHGKKCNRASRVIGFRGEQAEMILRQRPHGSIPICPA